MKVNYPKKINLSGYIKRFYELKKIKWNEK